MIKNIAQYSCPLEITIQLIGGKYKSLILWHLVDNTLRFNQLRRLIPDATQKMMTQQLRALEEDQLISRVVYPVVPPRVEYSLTDFGRSLIPVLSSMCDWGKDYLQDLGIKKCKKIVRVLGNKS